MAIVIPKCRDESCGSEATVVCIGPHGRTPYCDAHAAAYEQIMGHLGCHVEREAIGYVGVLGTPPVSTHDVAEKALLAQAHTYLEQPWSFSQAATQVLVRDLAIRLLQVRGEVV